MSIFGALTSAISGLTAQSAAFSNISDNVANSQTVGYKRVDTNFIDYLTASDTGTNQPGSVIARPGYVNALQGTISQSSNPLAMAINGQGFFPVSQQIASSNGQATFSAQQYYTRAGDFQMDQNGYLVNSAGQTLNGWTVNPTTGAVDRNALAPIQVNQTRYSPVATSTVALAANLPATPTAGVPISSQVSVYDALGTSHIVTLNWTQIAANDWTVAVNVPDDTGGAARGTAEVQFGALSGNAVPEGTPGKLFNATGSVAASPFVANTPATLSFTTNFGSGPQTIQLGLGNFGQTTGVTQYAGNSYSLSSLTQNGVPPGSYSGVTTNQNGDIVVNYDNGQSRTIAQVPLATFANPDALQRQNGQAFTASTESGTAIVNAANTNGSGGLATSSVEASNVDIASEFSKLIVAQQAYTANSKIVTTASDLLTATIDMKR